MEKERSGDTDGCQELDHFLVRFLGLFGDVVNTQGQQFIDALLQPPAFLCVSDDILAEHQPDLDKQNDHVTAVEISKTGHGRGWIGGDHDVDTPQRMTQVQEQGPRSHQQERQGSHEGEPGYWPQGFDVKHVVERRHDEGASH